MPEQKSEGSKKKGKRMVETNVRLTRDAHSRLRALASRLGLSMSDAVDYVVFNHYPEIEQERKLLEARKEELDRKRSESN